jgi:predicted GNAT family acetyltransferase
MAAPKKVDYERIEPGWRAGILSPAQLAAAYTEETGVSVSHTAILKHFRKLGVPRDLAAKVAAKADAMVLESMVTGKVSAATTERDAEIIDQSATVVATVQFVQRDDIKKSRSLVMKLAKELEFQTDNMELFEQIEEALESGQDGNEMSSDARAKMQAAFQRAMSLGSRISSMKALADALKTTITLEREAYHIGDLPPIDPAASLATAFSAAMTAANFKNLNDAELAALHGLMAKANSGEQA